MTLLPDYRARLVLQIDEDILLPKDTSAAIHTDGLFGGKYLVVDPGGDEETLRKGEMIRYTQDAVMVQDLLDLIIAEGKSLRGQAAAPEDRP
jgi:phospholipid/cholesterol/gamma-HCH transport system substrate-binding protein